MSILRTFLLVALATLSLSCSGYKLGGAVPEQLAHIDSIVIPQFQNDTLSPRLSALVTNTTVDALAQDGTFRIANSSKADAKLVGVIKQIKYQQFRANRFDTLRSDELIANLVIDWKLISLSNQRILKSGTAYGKTTFFVDDNFQTSKRNALPIAAEKAASKLVSSLTEGF